MVDVRVVTPADLGETLKLNTLEIDKYDVVFPEPIQEVALAGNNVVITSHKGTEHRVDLTSILPTIAKDVFLKNVEYTGDKNLRFTVGHRDDNVGEQVFTVNVSDLLPVMADELTITGNGTDGSVLKAKVPSHHPTDLVKDFNDEGDEIDVPSPNLIEKTTDGLVVSEKQVRGVASRVGYTSGIKAISDVHRASVRLTNATGVQTIGYIHTTEKM